jgi:hypothetical protein
MTLSYAQMTLSIMTFGISMECHFAECHILLFLSYCHAECHYVVMLNVIMLVITMLNVVMLSFMMQTLVNG